MGLIYYWLWSQLTLDVTEQTACCYNARDPMGVAQSDTGNGQ